MTNITIELITIEIVSFPMNSMGGSFHSYVIVMLVYQWVICNMGCFFVIPFHGIAVDSH